MSRLAEDLTRLSRNVPQTAEVAGVNQKVAWRVRILSVTGDAIVVFAVSLFSFWLRFRTGLKLPGTVERAVTLNDYAAYILVGGLMLMLLLSHYRFYESSQVLRYRQASILIIKACTIWLVGILCI